MDIRQQETNLYDWLNMIEQPSFQLETAEQVHRKIQPLQAGFFVLFVI